MAFGGEVSEETGEPFNTLDEMFMTIDAAKLCCRIYSNDIESGALEDHLDIIRTFLAKHPNPITFLKAQLNLLKGGGN